jgi:hypothetical protein
MEVALITKRIRLRTLAGVLTLTSALLALAVMLPGVASSSPPLSCHGSTTHGDSATTGLANDIHYKFGCSDIVTGFLIFSSTNREIDEYPPSALSYAANGDLGATMGQKDFECGGDLPGVSVSCTAGSVTGGYYIAGDFGLSSAPCAEYSKWWVIALNDKGVPSGPFPMGAPKGCKKPKVTKTKVHRKAATKKGTKK